MTRTVILLLFSACLAGGSASVAKATEPAPAEPAGMPQLVVQLAHRFNVTATAVSPDGSLIASGDDSHQVFLWDTASGKELRELKVPAAKDKEQKSADVDHHRIASLGFSPDGKMVVAVAASGLDVWEAATGRHLMRVGDATVWLPWCFTADSKRLVIGERCWTHSTGAEPWDNPQRLATPPDLAHIGQRQVTAATANDRWLVTGDDDGAILFYERDQLTPQKHWTLAPDGLFATTRIGENEPVTALAWTKSGKLLVGGAAGTVVLAGLDATRPDWQVDLRDPVERVTCSPDGKALVIRSIRSFFVLDCESGKQVDGFARYRAGLCGLFSADGRHVLTGHGDRVARLWDATTGEIVQRFYGSLGAIREITFADRGRLVAAADDYGIITVWTTVDGAVVRQVSLSERVGADGLPLPPVPPPPVAPSAAAPAGTSPFRFVQTQRPQGPPLAPAELLPLNPVIHRQSLQQFFGSGDELVNEDLDRSEVFENRAGQFCSDGNLAVSRSPQGTGAALNVASGQRSRVMPLQFNTTRILTLSPDAKFTVAELEERREFDYEKQVWLVATATGKRITKLAGTALFRIPRRARISADNVWVAVEDGGGVVQVLGASDGRVYSTIATGLPLLNAVTFSSGGTQVAVAERAIQIWDRASGKLLRTLAGHDMGTMSVAFSPDGKRLLSTGVDETARIWDVETGKELLRLEIGSPSVAEVDLRDDGSLLFAARDGSLQIQDRPGGTPRTVGKLCRPEYVVSLVTPIPGGDRLVVSTLPRSLPVISTPRLDIRAIDPEVQAVTMFDASKSQTAIYQTAAFRPGTFDILAISGAGYLRTWNEHGLVSRLKLEDDGQFQHGAELLIDDTGRYVGGFSHGQETSVEIRVWDAATGKLLWRGPLNVEPILPDLKFAITPDGQNGFNLIEAKTKRVAQKFPGAFSIKPSLDGRQLLVVYPDRSVSLWDAVKSKELHRFKMSSAGRIPPQDDSLPFAYADWMQNARRSVAAWFSPSGRSIVTREFDMSTNRTQIWDAKTGKLVCRLELPAGFTRVTAPMPPPPPPIERAPSVPAPPGTAPLPRPPGEPTVPVPPPVPAAPAAGKPGESLDEPDSYLGFSTIVFSPDEKWLAASVLNTSLLYVWDATTGELAQTIPAAMGSDAMLSFSPDGRLILQSGSNNSLNLWDRETGKLVCQLFTLDDKNWAVVDPVGRFDAPNGGAVDGLHWVIDNEPIDLEQLKLRYYEPDLLGKKLGTIVEAESAVEALTRPAMPPVVRIEPVEGADRKFKIVLDNRGGGIGRVVVKLNGREIAADARGPGIDPDAEEASLNVDLSEDSRLVKSGRNVVTVSAFNEKGYMFSRGMQLVFTAPVLPEARRPQVWLVACGVTDYRDNKRLRSPYASKDAQDISQALSMAAERLFGADRVHMTLLTSQASDPTLLPRRENLVRALAEASAAKSDDILVIYLAGHGITFDGDGDYYYLCADALSDDLRDDQVRNQVALSCTTLTGMIQRIPALKQVMILDTCAAGRVIDQLNKKRTVPSDQTRALDRLKDRTGMHVLAGCAADAVSYETSRYAQGVLTYSLLMGLRGAALRDEAFVDVGRLFDFSVDMVPQLAIDVGGKQLPRISAPDGSSFDIGELTREERSRVPLQTARPLLISSDFQEDDGFGDPLRLNSLVDSLLRSEAAARDGKHSFVGGRTLADSYRLAGRYRDADGRTTISVKVIHDEKPVRGFSVTGETKDPAALAAKVVAEFDRMELNPAKQK